MVVKNEAMFPRVRFLVRQILGIVGLQIKIEWIFSLVGILTNLRRRRLQTEKMIFVNKNWPNDPIIGCKSPSKLLKFFKGDMYLEKELEEFEREFEKDKVVEV